MFLMAVSTISCQQVFIKVPKGDVDTIKVNKFKRIAISYFNTLKTGETYNFKKIAAKEFNEKMTSDFQLKTYLKIKQEFGNLEILKFAGIWTKKTDNNIEIIRFKGKFSKTNKAVEIRIVINNLDKIIGFWVKPWKNNLNSII